MANICSKCGKEAEEGKDICSACANLENKDNGTQEVSSQEVVKEVVESKEEAPKEVSSKKSNKNKIIVAIVAAVIVLGAIGFGAKAYMDKKAHEKYVKEYNTYLEVVSDAKTVMLLGGVDAENISNMVSKIWNNAIWERSDAETDPFTKISGVFVDDFNTALQNYYSNASTIDTISTMEQRQSDMKLKMESLKDVPEGLEKHHEAIVDFYEIYDDFTDFAISPNGSLTSFKSKVLDLDDDFINKYDIVNELNYDHMK